MRNVPSHVNWEDLEALIANYGSVQQCEQAKDEENSGSVIITYETPDQAQQAVNNLNGYEFEGATLKAEYLLEQRNGRIANNRRNFRGNLYQGMANNQRTMEFPLRMLVPSDMVGAIIGRQGATIRTITQHSRARVDVHRKENSGTLEKAITIFGNPENCTQACKKIMEVMDQEALSTNKGEVPLKILAHNNLVGRIIGKNGNQIKKIMADSDTKITVSSIHDVTNLNAERIITVKGGLDAMSRAESMISGKLRQSFENDMAPQNIMIPSLHHMAMMTTLGNYQQHRGGGNAAPYTPYDPTVFQPPGVIQGMFPGALPTQMQQITETAYLYIPSAAVGAVIGTRGSHIRNIIRLSGASVKIASEDSTEVRSDIRGEPRPERQVTISGTPEAQWKSQFYIYDKIRTEGFVGNEEVRLRVEIFVPSAMVGRIIGKGGQNVREIQRQSGGIVKLPEESQQPQGDEVIVRIYGNFYASQSAQRRIRALIQTSTQQSQQVMRRGRREAPQ